MNDEQTAPAREDTMLYREPTDDSDESQVQDIWGSKLETRVVDASEVPELLSAGWVRNPLELGEPKKSPEEQAGFERVSGAGEKELTAAKDALAKSEELAQALTAERDELKAQLTEAEVDAANLAAGREALTENSKLKDEVASLTTARDAALAEIEKLKGDLKAAEELADGETKAKEAALAEVETLKAAAKTGKKA